MSRRAAPKANPEARSAQGSPSCRRAAPKANPAARSARITHLSPCHLAARVARGPLAGANLERVA